MKTLDEMIDSIVAQQASNQAKKREIAADYIERALSCVELNELIDIAHSIYAKQYSTGEIATHHTMQQRRTAQ